MYNILDGPYSLGSWVRGGTVFPKGIWSAGPKIGPDRIPYDTGLTFSFPAMLDSSAVETDSVDCDVLSPACAKYPLSQEVLNFITTHKATSTSNQMEVKEPLMDISESKEALLKELEEDLNSLASKS
eukprot:Em0011g318a